MFDLKPEIREALTSMEFVRKFKELSDEYSADSIPMDERLTDIDVNRVIQMVEELGYKPLYEKKEKFFHVEVCKVMQPNCQFNVTFALRDGRVELAWEVFHNGSLRLGSPWTVYSRLLIAPDYRIPLPAILSYEELEEILKINFEMYQEFQEALIALYSE